VRRLKGALGLAGSVAWLACAGAAGCGRSASRASGDDAPAVVDAAPRGPDKVLVGEVRVGARVWPKEGGAPPADREIEEQLRLALAASGLIEQAPWDPPPGVRVRKARIRLEYGVDVVSAEDKPPALEAALMMRLEWTDGSDDLELTENVLAEAPLAKGDDVGERAREHLRRTLADALRGLIEKEKVRRGDKDAILAGLAGRDPDLRQLAFAVAGERRMNDLVPRLIELLGNEDTAVRDGAIGALAELRDPRGVKPLTELARFGDHDMMRRIIDAIGAIGGDEARAYLQFVADGHEHPVIRDLARQALDRLERRSKRAP
jgi:hypothetical protein